MSGWSSARIAHTRAWSSLSRPSSIGTGASAILPSSIILWTAGSVRRIRRDGSSSLTGSRIIGEGSSPEGPSPIATAATWADADFGNGSLHEHVKARPARKPSTGTAAARRTNFCDEYFLVLIEYW